MITWKLPLDLIPNRLRSVRLLSTVTQTFAQLIMSNFDHLRLCLEGNADMVRDMST